MIKRMLSSFVVAAFLFASSAFAANQRIGSWLVTIEKDPFSTKKKSVALVMDSGSQAALVIRCFPDHGLSTILLLKGEKHFDPGTSVHFKYRADENEIVDDKGESFGEMSVELPNARQILVDAVKAKTIYFRVDTADASITDLSFSLRGASRALSQIGADCPSSSDDKKNGGASDNSGAASKSK